MQRQLKKYIVAIATIGLLNITALAQVATVGFTAVPPGATNYNTITAALSAVVSGDIWVKAGTYAEAELIIPKDVRLIGGFAGNETKESDRKFPGTDQNKTILDGSGVHRVATVRGVLNGFIVQNGYTLYEGGGLLVDGGIVQYCIIKNNQAYVPKPENFVSIAAGTFTMGCTDSDPDCQSWEEEGDIVTLSAYQISAYEVTNEQYAAFLNLSGIKKGDNATIDEETGELIFEDNQNGLIWTGTEWQPVAGKAKFPVVNVTWIGAMKYCEWLGAEYDLPTEAQWEYAAIGGASTKGTAYSGSATIGTVAWYSGNAAGSTHQVGTKTKNELNLYDMSGNAREWCKDSKYDYSAVAVTNPYHTGSSRKVVKGGGFDSDASDCRNRARDKKGISADSSSENLGFRVVKK